MDTNEIYRNNGDYNRHLTNNKELIGQPKVTVARGNYESKQGFSFDSGH